MLGPMEELPELQTLNNLSSPMNKPCFCRFEMFTGIYLWADVEISEGLGNIAQCLSHMYKGLGSIISTGKEY